MYDNQKQLDTFKDLLKNGEMIDLTISTEDGGNFKVFMEVMALHSTYFKKIIESEQKPPWEVALLGLSKETVAIIVDYAYSGKLNLRHNKIKELITAAEKLNMPDIIDLCKTFLASKLTVENCFSVYNLARHYFYDDLKESAIKFMLEHFEKIYATNPQYLQLPVTDLVSLLTADTLNVRSEESVYWAVIKWVESDIPNKSAHFPLLLRCVRVGLCDPKFFEEQIWPNAMMADSEDCQHFLFQASQLFADIQGKLSADEGTSTARLEIFDVHHPFLRPRVPNELIFVMGGWSAGSATTMIETFDVKTKRWFLTLYPDNLPRAYHGMLWHQNRIYVIGGFDGNQCFNSVRSYDPVSHAWQERGCMYVQRCYVSVAAVGNYIYAMGGYDGHRRNKSCERYDPSTNQWSMIACMRSVRSDASADSLDGNYVNR